jgi:hypothetical protein
VCVTSPTGQPPILGVATDRPVRWRPRLVTASPTHGPTGKLSRQSLNHYTNTYCEVEVRFHLSTALPPTKWPTNPMDIGLRGRQIQSTCHGLKSKACDENRTPVARSMTNVMSLNEPHRRIDSGFRWWRTLLRIFMCHIRRWTSSQMRYCQLLSCMELLEVSACVVRQAICPGHGVSSTLPFHTNLDPSIYFMQVKGLSSSLQGKKHGQHRGSAGCQLEKVAACPYSDGSCDVTDTTILRILVISQRFAH